MEPTDQPTMPGGVHRGHAAERRLLLWVLVVVAAVAVLGTVWLLGFRDQFRALFAEEQGAQGIDMARQVVRGLGLLVLAQAWGAAFWLGRRALAVRRTQRYPLPGSRTVLNQRVRVGEEAVRIGHLGLVGAALLVVVGAAGLWLSLR